LNNPYLTELGKDVLENQIRQANFYLEKMADKVPAGDMYYRLHKAYIHGLEFLFDLEDTHEKRR
jgi:hypothetical protein